MTCANVSAAACPYWWAGLASLALLAVALFWAAVRYDDPYLPEAEEVQP
jgi:hypothetical protein